MNANLTYQTGFVNAFVGYAARSIIPVTTMTQNADHMSGKNFSMGARRKPGAKPRTRKSTAAFVPATNPMASV